MASSTSCVMWFRRDLRLGDNPALLEACADGGVLPLFVVDASLWEPSGGARRAYLASSLRALDQSLRDLGGRLVVAHGDPVDRVVAAAREVDAERVHIAADYGPYGRRRDEAVEQALAEHDIELVRTGSSYAVAPGRVHNQQGNPYRSTRPSPRPGRRTAGAVRWTRPSTTTGASCRVPPSSPTPTRPPRWSCRRPASGPRWNAGATSSTTKIDDYDDDRNRPDLDGTSRLSAHLKWGEIHPRTLLADLAPQRSKGAETFRKELAWREFYADVLFHQPDSAREYLRPEFARMAYDDPGEQLQAWKDGRTGYPDRRRRHAPAAGDRLDAQPGADDRGVASWSRTCTSSGSTARATSWSWLVDGDLASNQHGWQWVAGSGTDAAPYFRIFNPTTQGRRFDPDGRVRATVGAGAGRRRRPARAGRHRDGYPAPIVDHAEERDESLARYERIKSSSS